MGLGEGEHCTGQSSLFLPGPICLHCGNYIPPGRKEEEGEEEFHIWCVFTQKRLSWNQSWNHSWVRKTSLHILILRPQVHTTYKRMNVQRDLGKIQISRLKSEGQLGWATGASHWCLAINVIELLALHVFAPFSLLSSSNYQILSAFADQFAWRRNHIGPAHLFIASLTIVRQAKDFPVSVSSHATQPHPPHTPQAPCIHEDQLKLSEANLGDDIPSIYS